MIDTAFNGEVARSVWEVPAKGRSGIVDMVVIKQLFHRGSYVRLLTPENGIGHHSGAKKRTSLWCESLRGRHIGAGAKSDLLEEGRRSSCTAIDP